MNNTQTINMQKFRKCDKFSVEPTNYRTGNTKLEFTIHDDYGQELEIKIKPIQININSLESYNIVPIEKGNLILKDDAALFAYPAKIPFNKIAKIEVVRSVPNSWSFKIFLIKGAGMFFNELKNYPNKGEWEIN